MLSRQIFAVVVPVVTSFLIIVWVGEGFHPEGSIMSIFRNTVWFIKGLKEYTKSGYAAASQSFKASDLDVDATGRSFMITGANSGIGKAAAIEIAKKGGTVHMVCRDKTRGEAALEEIKETSGNQNIHLHMLDMSEPRNVMKFATEFVRNTEKLNVLINNAGCMVNTRKVSEDGLEQNFATNTLGTYLLTVSLLPLLSRSDDPRVITVTSGGMLVQKLNVKDLQSSKMSSFDGTMVYAQNKRQQVVVTEQLAKKHPDIHFSCMHPGWSDTPAVKSAMPGFYEKMKDRLRSPEEGADTAIWLALSEAARKEPSGEFFQDRVVVSKHLPLAWTRTSAQEDEELITKLNEFQTNFKAHL